METPSPEAVRDALKEARERAAAELPCSQCGSTHRAVIRKPARRSFEWWDDPSAYLGCADCGALLEVLPEMLGVQWRPEVPSGDPDPSGEMAQAVEAASRELEELSAAGERVVERTLQGALGKRLTRSVLEMRLTVPYWDPQPGSVDLVCLNDRNEPLYAIETKFKSDNPLFECLWDAMKLVPLAGTPGIEAVYLVAGTRKSNWEKPIESAELFDTGRHQLARALMDDPIRRWWNKYILGDSTGRAVAAPAGLIANRVATSSLTLNETEWEIRAARIAPDPPDPDRWIPFESGVPEASPTPSAGSQPDR